METDIKVLQAAFAAEVSRREYLRCLSAVELQPPARELQDLVRAFEPVDLADCFPQPAPTAPALAETAAPAAPTALQNLVDKLRGTVSGKYLDHPRVSGLLERAAQRPGGLTAGNVLMLCLRAVVLRLPVLRRLAHIAIALRRLPEHLAALADQAEEQGARLRELTVQIQHQTNQGLYTHALATQQNEQHLLARLQRLEQRVRELQARPALAVAAGGAENGAHGDMPPDLYVDFEAYFRGHPDLIRQRLEGYLPRFRALAPLVSGAVLDLGCGRGEWLRLLSEAHFTVRGVDTNPSMVALCQQQNLDVGLGNAIDFLAQQPAQSLAAVTAFQVIEHLPFAALVALIDEARRALKPGGMILLETPNPENLIVGACNFYMDPSHRNPLPPALVAFLLEARGFVRVEIERRNPADPALRMISKEEGLATPLNNLLFGAQDYAAIGYVP